MRGSAQEVLDLLRAWEVSDTDEPLVIETSGSTGRPKRVRLSRAAMRASADATHRRLGGPGRWLLTVPPTFVAGVQVLYRSVRAGAAPVLGIEGLDDLAQRGGPGRGYLSLVPTQLSRMLEDPPVQAGLARVDAVLVGGGPLAPDVRHRAEAAGIRVVQTYGMSETCGGCVYDGIPLDGVAVKVDGTGRILLGGPVLFDGYDDDTARTAEVLRDGWFRTDDLGDVDEDGRLRVLGRVDDVILSGGLKVPPVAVEQMLAAHPRVQCAVVVGAPHPEWGEEVVAFVQPTEAGAPPGLEELRDLVHPRAWAPRRVRTLARVPLSARGKIDRVALRREAAGGD